MKLLMCDDDISTLDVIQNQIDWAELGFSGLIMEMQPRNCC